MLNNHKKIVNAYEKSSLLNTFGLREFKIKFLSKKIYQDSKIKNIYLLIKIWLMYKLVLV